MIYRNGSLNFKQGLKIRTRIEDNIVSARTMKVCKDNRGMYSSAHSQSRHDRFTIRKGPTYPFIGRMGGPQKQSERFGKEKNPSFQLVIETMFRSATA